VRIARDVGEYVPARLARAAAAALIVTAIVGAARLGSNTVIRPRTTAAGDALKTTTTTMNVVCPAARPRGVTRDGPSTLVVSTTNAGTEYTVPVGTVFFVRLDHGDGCNGPQWLAPVAGPSSVVQASGGTRPTFGATASGTFVVFGPGDGTIRFAGTCGSLKNCPLHFGWSIDIRAQPVPTPTTAGRLPRTGCLNTELLRSALGEPAGLDVAVPNGRLVSASEIDGLHYESASARSRGRC
jgi:hypothetical protein